MKKIEEVSAEIAQVKVKVEHLKLVLQSDVAADKKMQAHKELTDALQQLAGFAKELMQLASSTSEAAKNG